MLLWKRIQLALSKIGIYTCLAFVIIMLFTVLRIVLVASGWPATESDEGALDLMALHIGYQGDHPIFIYGQSYMGALESYLGAIFMHIFGISVFSVRLGLILLFVLFLISMYLLIRLLYTPRFAVFSLFLIGLGNSTMLSRQVKALGGRPEILFLGSTALLLASWLALTYKRESSGRKFSQRFFVYCLLGLVLGVGLWSDFIILPFILMIGLFLLLTCWREIFKWLVGLFPGFLSGVLPVIIFNISVPPGSGTDTWSTIQSVRQGPTSFVNFHLTLVQGIQVTIFDTLPNATGAYPLCPVELSPLPEHLGPHGLDCTLMYGGWAIGSILLWGVAVLLVGIFLWQLWQKTRARKEILDEEKQELIRNLARLMLLGSAALTLVLCALSPQTAVLPFRSVRYLTTLIIALPAVIWPFWLWGRNLLGKKSWPGRVLALVSQEALLLIGIILLLSTVNIFSEIPAAQATNQQRAKLIQDLTQIHVVHMYADYESCYWIIFATNEHMICSPLEDAQLRPFNKYMPYAQTVNRDPHSAYVFPIGSSQAKTMARLAATREQQYRFYQFDGYVIYVPS